MLIANLAEKVRKHANTSKRLFEDASPKLGAIRVPTNNHNDNDNNNNNTHNNFHTHDNNNNNNTNSHNETNDSLDGVLAEGGAELHGDLEARAPAVVVGQPHGLIRILVLTTGTSTSTSTSTSPSPSTSTTTNDHVNNNDNHNTNKNDNDDASGMARSTAAAPRPSPPRSDRPAVASAMLESTMGFINQGLLTRAASSPTGRDGDLSKRGL